MPMPFNVGLSPGIQVDMDEIHVRWKAPKDSDGPIFGYRLFWDCEVAGPDGEEYNEVFLPNNRHEYAARFIDSDTAYRFQGTS